MKVERLSDFQGIAEDMGDFFTPKECIDKTLVRSGRIKSKEEGVKWITMMASKTNDRLNIVVISHPQYAAEPMGLEMSFGEFGFEKKAKQVIREHYK